MYEDLIEETTLEEYEDGFQLVSPRHAAYFLYALLALCFLADRLGWLV